jgi:3-oxoadipate enol-lactonase
MPDSANGTFQTSDGCPIAYTLHPIAGAAGPRVALVHSLALDRSIWNGVVKILTGHAAVLTYDCRGHGQSGRAAMTYTTDLFARDLAELLDHVGWPAATVAGCSMGGCAAQAFGARYPQRTQGLCLIDTTAWYGPEAPKQWRERAATARSKGLGALIDFQVTRWFGAAFRAAHPEVVNALTRIFLANDVRCYEATCEMLGDADLRPLLPSITAPTAIVVGEEDYATPVSMAQALHVAIAGSTLTVISGGRHITPAERPAEIAASIAKLVRNGGIRTAAG